MSAVYTFNFRLESTSMRTEKGKIYLFHVKQQSAIVYRKNI